MKRPFSKAILTLAALLSGISAIQAETVVGFDLDSIPREIGYPKIHKYGIIARHKAYSIHYLQKYQLVFWLAYPLTKETLAGTYENVYEIGADPMTYAGFAEPGDYKGSGYVAGFLMPVDFASWDSTARREAFYMTNTAPQKRGFNKGVWKKMEALERTWVEQGARLWAVRRTDRQGQHQDDRRKQGAHSHLLLQGFLDREVRQVRGGGVSVFERSDRQTA